MIGFYRSFPRTSPFNLKDQFHPQVVTITLLMLIYYYYSEPVSLSKKRSLKVSLLHLDGENPSLQRFIILKSQ